MVHVIADHGTYSRYTYGSCRCAPCTEASRTYLIQLRARYLAEMVDDPTHRRHGTDFGYRCGCRCGPCKAAASKRRRVRR